MAEAPAPKPHDHEGEDLSGRQRRDGELTETDAQDFKKRILGGDDGVAPSPIVLFGEGNFTFSIALASLRTNGSEGITATTLDPKLPAFNTAQDTARSFCTHNGQKQGLSDPAIQDNIDQVSGVPDFSVNWHPVVDATNIPDWLQVAEKVVWFQCPWILKAQESDEITTTKLIKKYIQEMAKKQKVGDVLVIGISTHGRYIGEYKLKDILGETVINGYRYLGYDENIIKKILARGYQHHSDGTIDIHDFIIQWHSTLVFKREKERKTKKDVTKIEADLSSLTKQTAEIELNA